MSIEDARFFELGAGWDLLGPLVYQRLGVTCQHVVDIRPNAVVDQVNRVARRLEESEHRLRLLAKRPLAPGPGAIAQLDDLRRFGLRYEAPADASNTGLPGASVDAVTAYSVLQHVPRPALLPLFREVARILGPGGLFLAYIDLEDQYADADDAISVYNFLRFSDRAWRAFNSGLQYMNRLRARDYRDALAAAGFEIAYEETAAGDERALLQLPVARRFSEEYSHEELLPTSIRLVAVAGPSPAATLSQGPQM